MSGDQGEFRTGHRAVVEHLVADVTPVQPLWPVRRRLLVWGTLGLGLLAATLAFAPRPDLAARVGHGPFLASELLALAAASYFAVLALRRAVPGREPHPLEPALALGLTAAAGLVATIDAPPGWPPASFGEGVRCCVLTLLVGALPWAALIYALARGAPVHPAAAGAEAGAAAMLVAAAVTRTGCPHDGPLHVLAGHFGAVPLAATASLLGAAVLLRTWTGSRGTRPGLP